MKVSQRLKQNFIRDKQTLKALPFRQKMRFILDYYKGCAIMALCVCLLCFYIWDVFTAIQQETVLEGFFTNDEENLFPAKSITREFSEYLDLAPGQQILLDDSLYILPGSSIDYHAASQSKIVAYVSAQELDFLVTTEELMKYYSKNFSLCDLEHLLPDDLVNRLGSQFYYNTDGTGVKKACAVNLSESRFYKEKGLSQSAPHYLMVLSYTEHKDTLIQFLEYAFPEST